MSFCPSCGNPLKSATPSQAVPAQTNELNPNPENDSKPQSPEKQTNQHKSANQGKGDTNFITYLVSGLILLTIGAFAIFQISSPRSDFTQNLTIMLSLIGAIIIASAVYIAFSGRNRSPNSTLERMNKEEDKSRQ